jgi:regulatory protein SWI6
LTAQLAEQRREQQRWRDEVTRTEEQAQRVKNLQNAIDAEDAFDWTGRTELDGSPASALAGPGFTYRGPGSTLSQVPSSNLDFDTDPPLPETDQGVTGETLVHLLRLQSWYERVEGLMKERVEKLEGGNVELEGKLKRIVAGTCGVDESRVDDLLISLVTSLETCVSFFSLSPFLPFSPSFLSLTFPSLFPRSDSSALDLGRVAGFLNRVKDGSL